MRYLFLDDFFDACFGGFAEEVVAGTTSAAFFLAQRAPTILRACALRSSGVSLAQRALPPSDWIVLRCSRTVRSFLTIFITEGRGCPKYNGTRRSVSREILTAGQQRHQSVGKPIFASACCPTGRPGLQSSNVCNALAFACSYVRLLRQLPDQKNRPLQIGSRPHDAGHEAKVLQTLLTLDRLPHAIKLVRPPFTIAARFTKKDQIRIFGSRRIAHGSAEKLNSLYAQWDSSWLGIFRLKQTDDSSVEVHLYSAQRQNFGPAHPCLNSNPDDPAHHWI